MQFKRKILEEFLEEFDSIGWIVTSEEGLENTLICTLFDIEKFRVTYDIENEDYIIQSDGVSYALLKAAVRTLKNISGDMK